VEIFLLLPMLLLIKRFSKMRNPHKNNIYSNRNTNNITTVVENANLCRKICDMHILLNMQKCSNMRNLRQKHNHVELTCLSDCNGKGVLVFSSGWSNLSVFILMCRSCAVSCDSD